MDTAIGVGDASYRTLLLLFARIASIGEINKSPRSLCCGGSLLLLFGIETLRSLRVPLLCVIAPGLALVGLSYGWTTLYPPAANWSPAQAAELTAVDAEVTLLYKKLTDAQHRGVAVPKEPIPLVRLLEKDAALRQEMEFALGASARTAKKLRLAGVATLCAGVAIYFYGKSCKCSDG